MMMRRAATPATIPPRRCCCLYYYSAAALAAAAVLVVPSRVFLAAAAADARWWGNSAVQRPFRASSSLPSSKGLGKLVPTVVTAEQSFFLARRESFLERWRGGGTASAEEDENSRGPPPHRHSRGRRPILQVSDVVLAVRWTAEMNRQLVCASSASAQQEGLLSLSSPSTWSPPRRIDALRGGGDRDVVYRISLPQKTAPSDHRVMCTASRSSSTASSSSPPLLPSPTSSPELTIFHAKHPRVSASRRRLTGISRWGPDLNPYLEHLLGLLRLNSRQDNAEPHAHSSTSSAASTTTVLTLALLYADRAASVETPRSSGYPAVPYLTPRTCHRILLASVLLAYQAVNVVVDPTTGNENRGISKLYDRVSESLGLPMQDLHEMVAWLKGALGDPGWYVAPDELLEFQQLWEYAFGGGADDPVAEALAAPRIANTISLGGPEPYRQEFGMRSPLPLGDSSNTFVSTPMTVRDDDQSRVNGQTSGSSDDGYEIATSGQQHPQHHLQQQRGSYYSPLQAIRAGY